MRGKTPVERVQRACARCGCSRLSVQVAAWADFVDGEFQALDTTEYVELLWPGAVICHECGQQADAEPQK